MSFFQNLRIATGQLYLDHDRRRARVQLHQDLREYLESYTSIELLNELNRIHKEQNHQHDNKPYYRLALGVSEEFGTELLNALKPELAKPAATETVANYRKAIEEIWGPRGLDTKDILLDLLPKTASPEEESSHAESDPLLQEYGDEQHQASLDEKDKGLKDGKARLQRQMADKEDEENPTSGKEKQQDDKPTSSLWQSFRYSKPITYLFDERPRLALIAFLIGIGLLLCITPFAPITLPALGLGMLLMTSTGLIVAEAVIAFISGMLATHVLITLAEFCHLGWIFRVLMRGLEAGLKGLASFVFVIIPSFFTWAFAWVAAFSFICLARAYAFWNGIKFLAAKFLAGLFGGLIVELPLLLFHVVIRMTGALFAASLALLMVVLVIVGVLLETVAMPGYLLAFAIIGLDPANSILKTSVLWLAALLLSPFLAIKKVGETCVDIGWAGFAFICTFLHNLWDNSARSFTTWIEHCVAYLKHVVYSPVYTADDLHPHFENERWLEARVNTSVVRHHDEDKSNESSIESAEVQEINILCAKGFFAIPKAMAEATWRKNTLISVGAAKFADEMIPERVPCSLAAGGG